MAQIANTLQQFMHNKNQTVNKHRGTINKLSIQSAKVALTLRSEKEVSRSEMPVDQQTVAPIPEVATEIDEGKEKSVKINIPLLDTIQQVNAYAKFLKDLCTIKRKLDVKKKAFLTEQVSALILSQTPQKLKDPGSPTNSIMIGESRIGRVLLDFVSSVNLLPYSIYEQLGLGELKKTSMMLQLANRNKSP
ncbi:uncharacterized protein LOC131166678 [Malania oleifera]|uniref:uncharacterized protein LOC131166678 n=1 Tax=Malania oleifera TaxID=397392 RepID=UPI0025ADA2AC|nr:uncharacterized protein LOC131166678 [Malania oleifera]